MNNQNEVRWIAKGMTYQSLKNGKTSTSAPQSNLDDEILIPESEKGLIMKPGNSEKPVFGMAIDGKLAIYYIRKLWTTLDDKNVLELRDKILNKIHDIRLEFTSKSDFNEANVDSYLKDIENFTNLGQSWILELLNHSAAITMDKNYILKTLSQPECEGIRFYLCMKDRPEALTAKEDENIKFYPEELINQTLTFTTVGVNKDGHDLHYSYPENQPQAKPKDEIPEIENCSLCTEYSYTSGKLSSKKFKDPDLTPYALFKYAKTQ